MMFYQKPLQLEVAQLSFWPTESAAPLAAPFLGFLIFLERSMTFEKSIFGGTEVFMMLYQNPLKLEVAQLSFWPTESAAPLATPFLGFLNFLERSMTFEKSIFGGTVVFYDALSESVEIRSGTVVILAK